MLKRQLLEEVALLSKLNSLRRLRILFMSLDPTRRFSGREEAYSNYRPRYPAEILRILESTLNLQESDVVADIGSGTGILAELFLKNGNRVFGVEPNNDMRHMAERNLSKYSNFISVDGSAEDTKLRESSIDLITVGQALHWFDLSRSRIEFQRILTKGGNLCIVYNTRSVNEPVMREYGDIVRLHAKKDIPMNEYAAPDGLLGSSYSEFNVPNKQHLDFDGLVGRAVSASYSPGYDDEGFSDLERDLKIMFEKWQTGGTVTLDYLTKIFIGHLTS